MCTFGLFYKAWSNQRFLDLMNKIKLSIITFSLLAGVILSLTFFKTQPVQLQAGTWFGEQAKPLPDFQLLDQNMEKFGKEKLTGKWSLLFFGYTNCPDVCPGSLQMLDNMLNSIEDKDIKKQIQVLFISVDPWRDTPQKLKQYVQYFNPEFLSASADIPQLNVLTKALGILHYTGKTEDSQQEYDVAHSGSITLIDPQARYIGIFSSPHDSNKIAVDMKTIISHN